MYSRQWGKINTEPAPIGALSQCCTHATLFMESFLKNEAKFRLQQLRGRVMRSGFNWITMAFLLWPLVSTLWGTSQGIRPPFHYCRNPNLLLSINIAIFHWWRGWMVEIAEWLSLSSLNRAESIVRRLFLDRQRERLVLVPTSFTETYSSVDLPKEDLALELRLYLSSLWLIISDFDYGSTQMFMFYVMSCIFSDWYIIACIRFYACYISHAKTRSGLVGITSVRRGDLPLQQIGESTGVVANTPNQCSPVWSPICCRC